MSDLEKKIEALLFVAGEPMSPEKLSKLLKKDKEEIKKALGTLGDNLLERGIRVSRNNNEYILITAPELSGAVEDYMKEELGEDLSRATLETLAVIVYKGSLSRAKIDYIRGVNSSFTVRNLMIRGLVERKPDPDDSRSWLYSPSFDFLKYMGIERIENLAGYEDFKKEMDELLKREIKEEE
ncbi:SMC-Scp complex subunit ScpB [Candidatus Giovannonibacteria bacterium RIFCSPLOWO2_02_FULL_45_14]|uniref:SMC-Scp complex subunit ScpB n=1 Tax=Candidatus Giovannonibacteria bacterium RIFCSPLOWO2_12_FULL_44_15 TaxID=1798364 RepID=A0A1F5Y0B6_9BACT|nr:MAG: SMC-Scp complex subunit ScpB [Candidatus Giovannonibacteria bacterium RIFCSPHIGHO2_02_FULL_44_31]OGF75955.1 MAG: SMC-Scp complex subunit ScpB [Candidatus Giovannonibacteria bacterium RIFCSPHIGHO2_12_FULL_44_29]OGF91015.1 MAG: SMC-Scp complex subunit ScpB [Candidatus Giovannonibacteria bacterium RIFCSPLOWO2_02_FULL_45_14]OGF93291.1 MAG: SMC-Scp complex subunit ScpB [Candidatus Giovannonibacteria bacterium RIFCSPLOWO2_12_FULL_44_15]